MIRDCLTKDRRLLASIFAGQALPPIKTVSNLSCQGSNYGNIFTVAYTEGASGGVNSPLIVSYKDSIQPIEEEAYWGKLVWELAFIQQEINLWHQGSGFFI